MIQRNFRKTGDCAYNLKTRNFNDDRYLLNGVIVIAITGCIVTSHYFIGDLAIGWFHTGDSLAVISHRTRNLPELRFKSFTGKTVANTRKNIQWNGASWPIARLAVDIETSFRRHWLGIDRHSEPDITVNRDHGISLPNRNSTKL